MKTIDGGTLAGALNWRYATKPFDPAKKIDPAGYRAESHKYSAMPKVRFEKHHMIHTL